MTKKVISKILLISIFLVVLVFMSVFSGSSESASGGVSGSGDGYDEEMFRKAIMERCNVFSDKADKIILEAKKAGVSPVLFAAIMAHESAWGQSSAIKNQNNPSGQMGSNGLITFSSLDEGIEGTGATLKNLVVERQLQTIEKLGSVYCPVGADNDPTGLNVNWVPTIKSFLVIFGGTENMSLLWSEKNTGGENTPEGGTSSGAITLDPPEFYKDKLTLPKYNGMDYNSSGSYPYGQCTWYVFNRMAQLGFKVDDYMGNGGQWGSIGAAKGFITSSTPKVGWAMSIPGGVAGSAPEYGHVAFVEYINLDGSVLVSECNVFNPGSGAVSYRVLAASVVNSSTFVKGK
jgi:surface antigen